MHDLPPERVELLHRLAALPSATQVLLEALDHHEPLTQSLLTRLLDRVPDDELPQIAEAIVRNLPDAGADDLGQLLLLQAPELLEGHVDDLSDGSPYFWLDDQWDGDRPLVALPPHHIVIHGGVDEQASIEAGVRIGHSEQWEALRAPDPTLQPSAAAVGAGRVGGLAAGHCSACGWQLHRVLDLGSFPGVDEGTVPASIVACPNAPCMWTAQCFSHTGDEPVSVARVNELPEVGMPVPDPVPDLPVTFHPTPPRWHVQDWGLGGNLNRVGGVGSWVQDAIYPTCPSCSRTMPIVAQFGAFTPFDGSPGWEAWTEGIIYAFWCRDCRMSAVTSQQT